MRPLLSALSAALALAAAHPAAAESSRDERESPNAREAYVERRGLLEADSACALLSPSIRGALEIGAAQARGALLRAGWSSAQMRALESAAVSAARARACSDPRTLEAAADAGRAFAGWVNTGTMTFPGWDRSWIARRSGAQPAWRLSQAIDAPVGAVFGVRETGGVQRLELAIPVERGESAPLRASLAMRDAARARAVDVSLPERIAYGLAAGAPAPNAATEIASTRAIERLPHGHAQAVFTFPDSAFRALLELDPRESVALHVVTQRGEQTLYVEIGDVAAARAFLVLR